MHIVALSCRVFFLFSVVYNHFKVNSHWPLWLQQFWSNSSSVFAAGILSFTYRKWGKEGGKEKSWDPHWRHLPLLLWNIKDAFLHSGCNHRVQWGPILKLVYCLLRINTWMSTALSWYYFNFWNGSTHISHNIYFSQDSFYCFLHGSLIIKLTNIKTK